MARYEIDFDFDGEGDPPEVQIVDTSTGEVVITVHEEPTATNGGRLVEVRQGVWEWRGPYSWEPEDWQPGPLAAGVLKLMNEYSAS